MFYIIHVHVLMYTLKCKSMFILRNTMLATCTLRYFTIFILASSYFHILISKSRWHSFTLLSYVNFVIYVSDLGFLMKFYRTILYIGLLAYTCSLDTIALMNISDGNGILGHFSESSILIIRKLSGYVTVFVKYNFCVLSFLCYA